MVKRFLAARAADLRTQDQPVQPGVGNAPPCPWPEKLLYLVAIMDWHSQYVVAV